MPLEVQAARKVGHHNLAQNQRYLHRLRQPSPWQLMPDVLRYNASLLDQHRVNQNFHDHQLMAAPWKNFAPYELMHRKLHHLHVGATYPLLHQQHVHSLHVHALDEDPYRPSDEECDGALALNHRGHLAKRANKLPNMRTQEKIQKLLWKHRYQRFFLDIHRV